MYSLFESVYHSVYRKGLRQNLYDWTMGVICCSFCGEIFGKVFSGKKRFSTSGGKLEANSLFGSANKTPGGNSHGRDVQRKKAPDLQTLAGRNKPQGQWELNA